MKPEPLRILLVEDNDLDAELTTAALADAGLRCAVTRVQDPAAFEAALADPGLDLVLSDYVLPNFSGMAALKLARRNRPDLPFVFVSGVLGEELAIEGIKGGATDYVLKQRLERVGPAVRRAVAERGAPRPAVRSGGDPASGRAEAALLTSAARGDRLDLAQQSARIGVFDWDMTTGVVFWNDEEERIFGIEPGTFEGSIDAWAARTVPEDAARVRAEVEQAARERRPTLDFAFRLRRASDGQLRWVEGSGRFVYDADGAPARLVGLNIDVTDRRLAEERLRQGVERQRFLADATKLLTSSLKFEEVAQGLADIAVPMLGDCCFFDALGEDGTLRRVAWAHRDPDRRELFARIVEFVPPPSAADHPVAVAIRTGRRQFVPDASGDWLRRAAGGAADHLAFLAALGLHSLITVPLRAGEQVLGAMTFALTDTPRHHTPDDLDLAEELGSRAAIAVRNARLFEAEQRARAQAEASASEAEFANRAKDQFLATLSHELRTPLNAIVGWVQLLRMGVLDPAEAKDALAKIQAGADAQKQLIEDILDVSRIIHGKLKVDSRRVDLGQTVSAAIDAVRPAAAGKGVTLAYRPADRPMPIDGDPQRLQQVVWNLLNNAVKFTPARGQVRVSVEPAGDGRARVVVADSGKGISPEFLPHVFERFRQADGSTTRRYAGLGIGLAIARHVTELHGGSVAADSAGDGKGATFTVTLPLAGPACNGATAAGSAHTGGLVAEGDGDFARLDGIRVVVVDDDDDGREVVRAALSASGAEVVTSANAADGFDAVVRHRPDVLISDIAMPGEDGYSLVGRVRNLDGGTRQPLAIAVTAFASEDDRHRAISAKFDHHVAKPVDPAELTRLIARGVRKG